MPVSYCAPYPQIGERCDAFGEDPEERVCEVGAVCDEAGSSAVCGAARQPGEGRAWEDDEACVDGLHCDVARCVCERRAERGEACYDGRRRECARGLKCVLPLSLACESRGDCGGINEQCCAVEGGAECRRIDGLEACVPPERHCEPERDD